MQLSVFCLFYVLFPFFLWNWVCIIHELLLLPRIITKKFQNVISYFAKSIWGIFKSNKLPKWHTNTCFRSIILKNEKKIYIYMLYRNATWLVQTLQTFWSERRALPNLLWVCSCMWRNKIICSLDHLFYCRFHTEKIYRLLWHLLILIWLI